MRVRILKREEKVAEIQEKIALVSEKEMSCEKNERENNEGKTREFFHGKEK